MYQSVLRIMGMLAVPLKPKSRKDCRVNQILCCGSGAPSVVHGIGKLAD